MPYPSKNVIANLQIINLNDVPGIYSRERIPYILAFAIREAFVRGQMENFDFLKTKSPARWSERKEYFIGRAGHIKIDTEPGTNVPRMSTRKIRGGKRASFKPPEWSDFGADWCKAMNPTMSYHVSDFSGQIQADLIEGDDQIFVTQAGADRAWYRQWLEDNGIRA